MIKKKNITNIRKYFVVSMMLLGLCACSQGQTLPQQYRDLERIDRMQGAVLSDELLIEVTFGYSDSEMTIADFLPEQVQRYGLSDEEVLTVGQWHSSDRSIPGFMAFLPNGISLHSTGGIDSSGSRVMLSVGKWRIEGEDILTTIYGYLWRDESWDRSTQVQHFTRTEPQDFVIGRVSYINADGYTARPFRRIDYRSYLDSRFEQREDYTFEPTVFVRSQYSEDIVNGHRIRYDYLNIVFAMEDRDIEADELLQSDELLEAMVAQFAWVIDRRLEALGL